MAITAKALREQRKPIAAEMRRLSDEGLAVGADGNYTEGWVKANADYNALSRKIDAAEAADQAEAEQAARVGDPDVGRTAAKRAGTGANPAADRGRVRAAALAGWMAGQLGRELTEEQAEACGATGVKPSSKELAIRLPGTAETKAVQREFRRNPHAAMDRAAGIGAAMSDFSGPAGGYLTAPPGLTGALEVNMLAFGGMRQVADPLRTTTGERLNWPTADDTTNKGALLGESKNFDPSGALGANNQPQFAQVFFDAYKFTSLPLLVPYELIQDSLVNLEELIGRFFGERFGRVTNDYYTSGTGIGQPKGILNCCGTSPAASATAIVSDDLIKMQHSIDPAYRAGASWMMNDAVILLIRLLKDQYGRYLWVSGDMGGDSGIEVGGTPDKLLGQPITLNQSMPTAPSSGVKSLVYGQLAKYKIRTVGEMRMYRLTERYRDNDQDGFVGFIREDGNMLDTGTKPVKALQH